jgi:HSP20 family protein
MTDATETESKPQAASPQAAAPQSASPQAASSQVASREGAQPSGNGSGTAQKNGPDRDRQGNGRTRGAVTFAPPADVYETKDEVLLVLDMPGAEPDTLDVTLDKRVLTVSAQSNPWAPEGYTLVEAEYRDGNYERSFILSDQLDGEHIDARFKDGVLRIKLPKAPPPPAKKIAVNAE